MVESHKYGQNQAIISKFEMFGLFQIRELLRVVRNMINYTLPSGINSFRSQKKYIFDILSDQYSPVLIRILFVL